MEWINDIDTRLFLFLNSFHSPVFDQVMVFVSGKYSWIPLYALILYWYIRKYRKNFWVPVVATIVLITLADQSSVHLFKNVFERLRPCHNPEIQHMVHIVNNKCGGQFGFVSSHASNTFALAMFTALVFRSKPYGWAIFLWAALVSYSRIYLGRHFPGDILGGGLLGILIGYFVYWAMQKILLKTIG
jgi:undecaprenyl-diphosphatase